MYRKERKHVSVIVFISHFLEGFSDLGRTGFIVPLASTHKPGGAKCVVKEVGLVSPLPSSRKQVHVSSRELHCPQSLDSKKTCVLKLTNIVSF